MNELTTISILECISTLHLSTKTQNNKGSHNWSLVLLQDQQKMNL